MYIPKSPFILCIELTKQCNLSCKHCSVDADLSSKRKLLIDKVLSIVEESEHIGVKEIVLGGGEPLLYENFFELCEYILSKGLSITFVTNGTLVSEKMSSFLKLKKYFHSLQVGISLDGHTPELHGYFRSKETFQPAVEAIKRLNKAGIKVSASCVLNKANIKTIPEYLEFLSILNVSNVRILPFMPVGRGKQYKEEMLSSEEFHDIILGKCKWGEVFYGSIGFHMPWEFLSLPPEKRQPSPCEAGYLRLWINSSGDIFPCSYMENLPIGNIYCDSISDVWNNSPILKAMRNPELLKGVCASCQYRDGCRGGCRGLAYFMEGDYLCSDPYCPIVVQNKNVQA
jgi:radical SAM protein with 4Fe4S-binding SPASM domain